MGILAHYSSVSLPILRFITLYVLPCNTIADQGTVGQAIASGTQDLAALARLSCTDSVEKNSQATQNGSISVAMSSLSMLGLLGLVKSTLKITLGLERCRAAGFNLDSIRGLFGYAKDETAVAGNMVGR